MARIQLQFKAPGMPQARDAFATEDEQWFKLDRRFYRVARSDAPATVTFAYVDRPELIDDFLKPPMNPGPRGVARFRYPDSSGKARVFDLSLEGQEGKSFTAARQRPDGEGREGGRLSRQRGRAVPGPRRGGHPGRHVPGEQGPGARRRAFRHGLAADGPQRHAQSAGARGQALRTPGLDPPDDPSRPRSQDQRQVRADRRPGRAGSLALLPGFRPRQGGQDRAALGRDRSRRGRRSTPSAAGPGCP